MQQQQLERQTLQSEMAATQLGIAKVERGAQQGRADAAAGVSGRAPGPATRGTRSPVALKANQLEPLTHTLMPLIGSLRKARKRHLEAAAGVQAQERPMDADSSCLLSSAYPGAPGATLPLPRTRARARALRARTLRTAQAGVEPEARTLNPEP